MAIYAKFDGVTGKVSTGGYEQYVELLSFQWGYNAGGNRHVGTGKDITVNTITLKMRAEQASIDLLNRGLSSASIPKVKIECTTTMKDKVGSFMTVELTNALIQSYDLTGDNQDVPVETLTLSFQKIQIGYKALDAKMIATPKTITYDLTSATTS